MEFNLHTPLVREVAVLADGAYAAGTHTASFNAAGLPAGLYVVTLRTPGRTLSTRILHAR